MCKKILIFLIATVKFSFSSISNPDVGSYGSTHPNVPELKLEAKELFEKDIKAAFKKYLSDYDSRSVLKHIENCVKRIEDKFKWYLSITRWDIKCFWKDSMQSLFTNSIVNSQGQYLNSITVDEFDFHLVHTLLHIQIETFQNQIDIAENPDENTKRLKKELLEKYLHCFLLNIECFRNFLQNSNISIAWVPVLDVWDKNDISIVKDKILPIATIEFKIDCFLAISSACHKALKLAEIYNLENSKIIFESLQKKFLDLSLRMNNLKSDKICQLFTLKDD